jgi:O-antigen ligase
MKWIVLLALFAAVPMLANWLNTNHNRAHYVWAMLGFLPFCTNQFHLLAAPISWSMWPGYVKGIEVTALDALALAIVMSKPLAHYKLPFKRTFFLYVFAVVFSISQSNVPMASAFYVWQLLRVFLYFSAVAWVAASERGIVALLTGLVLGMAFTSGFSIAARIGGAIRTGGSLGHENSLGFISHLITLPLFSCILAGRYVKLAFAGLICCLVAVILTASRAGIGIGAAGLVLTYALSVFQNPSGRKASMGLAMGALFLIALPFAQNSLQRRYDSQEIAMAESGDYDERAAMAKAAKAMSKDHPLGVGSNMYVVVANTDGYSEKAGVIWNASSRGANVHNVYLLFLAETGYLGLAAFACLLLNIIYTGISTAWKFRSDSRAELLVGITAGLTMAGIHNFFEWIFVLFISQYLFAISMGLVAGLCFQLRSKAQATDLKAARRPPLVRVPSLQPQRLSNGKI